MVGIDDARGQSRLGTVVDVTRFCCSCFVFVILCLNFSYPVSFPCYYFVFSFSMALVLAPLLLLSCGVLISFCSKLPVLSLPVLRPHLQQPLGTQEKKLHLNSTQLQQHRLMACTWHAEYFKNELKLSEASTKVQVWGKFWV